MTTRHGFVRDCSEGQPHPRAGLLSFLIETNVGRLVAAAGRPLPAIDSLLTATALVHGLTLVTRNTQDFAGLPVPMVDPWAAV